MAHPAMRRRTGNGERWNDHEEAPDEHRDRERQRIEIVGGGQAGKGGAVVPDRAGERVEDLGEAVRTLVERPSQTQLQHR